MSYFVDTTDQEQNKYCLMMRFKKTFIIVIAFSIEIRYPNEKWLAKYTFIICTPCQ